MKGMGYSSGHALRSRVAFVTFALILLGGYYTLVTFGLKDAHRALVEIDNDNGVSDTLFLAVPWFLT